MRIESASGQACLLADRASCGVVRISPKKKKLTWYAVLEDFGSQIKYKLIPKIAEFLETRLKLLLHPNKVFIKTVSSGVDFLGWINYPHHRVLRTATKRRMFRRIKHNSKPESVASYLGLLSHGDTHKISSELQRLIMTE